MRGLWALLLLAAPAKIYADSPDLAAADLAFTPSPSATSAPGIPAKPDIPPEKLRYSSAWVEATLRDYHARYPQSTRLVRLGTSLEGRAIWALVLGRHLHRSDRRPAMLLNGAHHGVEFLSIDFVMDAIQTLLTQSGAHKGEKGARDRALEARLRRFLDELTIWCVPVVNPDGVWASLQGNAQRTGRKNGRDTDENGRIDAMDGVDLNRNYPFKWGFLGEAGSSSKPQSYYYRGPQPGSEPETQAMMRLGESEHFAAAISYHTGTVAVLAPYTIDNVSDPTPNEAWMVGEYVVAGLPMHPQGKPFTLRHKIYSVDGTDQDYYRANYGTVALLVEGARRDAKDQAERQAVVSAVAPSWLRLFDRFVEGPTLSGRVRDVNGRPVTATVSIVEIATHEGENWRTRCRDGRFDRFLPGPGRYTLRVQVVEPQGSAPRPPIERQVEVLSGRQEIDITVPIAVSPSRCPDAV